MCLIFRNCMSFLNISQIFVKYYIEYRTRIYSLKNLKEGKMTEGEMHAE